MKRSESIALVLTAMCLLAFSVAHAGDRRDEPRVVETIKTQVDVIAAIECSQRKFPYMLRLSREYVICLASRSPNSVAVIDVLRRAP